MLGTTVASLLALAGTTLTDEIITATDSLSTGQEGWAQSSSYWSPVTCDDPSQTFVMSSTYGRCCANTHLNCGFATSCISTGTDVQIKYGGGGSSLCTSGETCAFMTIYDYATTDTPYLDIFCANEWPESASTIFRRTEAATTSTSDSQTTASAAPGSSPTTSIAAATTTASSSAGESDKKDNKSWIAGAVIGPVAGCALLGALGFWLARRKRNQSEGYQQDKGQDNGFQPVSQSRGFSELDSRFSPQELPAYGNSVPSELPSEGGK